MRDRILIVDDEKNLLEALQRKLRKDFALETALGPDEGLAALKNRGPFSVVISDLRMPGMDGIQFLSRVKETSPDTVRMMLTGNADLESAIEAVNEGNIFRFLTKPCPPDVLAKVIHLGIEQYRLVTAERELLQKTLKGSIQVMTEILSLANPEAFGRSSRIKRYVKEIAEHLEIPNNWQLELAVMLSQIGCVVLPEEAIKKLNCGRELNQEQTRLFERHPMIASDLISKIPRLEKVAEVIRYQEKHFDGSGNPKDTLHGESIPLGSRILKVALDFDLLEAKGIPKSKAIVHLKERSGWYDPRVLNGLEAIVKKETVHFMREISVRELQNGMIIDDDIWTKEGQLVISRGQEVGSMLLSRLKSFADTRGIQEPIRVLAPVE